MRFPPEKGNPMNYNLLDEKWIPVLYHNGRWERIGIREALNGAGAIRQIATSNPMDRVAIIRFLLALLYWCKGNPPDDASVNPRDSFPTEWFSKLDKNKECFNLLGKGKRFYQDPTSHRARAATDLMQEIPTGNNFWHFRHSTDEKDRLCPACCAIGLLRLPLFSVSGLPDLKAGINGSPPVYILPLGNSLLETLQANWMPRGHLGDPAWIDPLIRPQLNQEVPLLIGFTILSRRVWLHEPVEPPGQCISCGAKGTSLIRTCEFETAGEQKNDLWNDPHVLYSTAPQRKSLKTVDPTAAGKFRMDRPWTDLLARVVETGKFISDNKPTTLLVVGFATDKAKNIDVWERTITVPARGSMKELSGIMPQQWRYEGWRMEKRIGRSKIEGPVTLTSIRPDIEKQVSADAEPLLVCSDSAWKQAILRYRPMMQSIAQSISPGFTATAMQRRRDIASLLPDMNPKTEPAKKTNRKKGAAK